MKVTITTLTGEKHELDVHQQDTVKDMKRQLYKAGKVSSVVRLLYGQQIILDQRPLTDYNLPPEGAVISALLEPDVDIMLEIGIGHVTSVVCVSNATNVMALKVLIYDVIKCNVKPEEMELLFDDLSLDNAMPVHFYGVIDGSKLNIVKPYVTVSIEDNYGDVICKRLNKKDTIREVKFKLSQSMRSSSPPPPMEDQPEGPGHPGPFHGHLRGLHRPPHHHGPGHRMKLMREMIQRTKPAFVARHASVDDMRLYVIKVNKDSREEFDELADSATVLSSQIQEHAQLYLLSYKWTNQDSVNVTCKTGVKVLGVESEDTIKSVTVRVQDQFGLPAGAITLRSGGKQLTKNSKISSVANAYPFRIEVV